MYPQSIFRAKIRKTNRSFLSKMYHFTDLKGLESIRGFFGLRFSENSKFNILCSLHLYHEGIM